MDRKYTNKQAESGLVLEGLKVAGHAAGMKVSKPKIKKEMETSISLVNQLLEMVLTKRGNNNKREVELASLGLIALYNFYLGVKKKKKSSLVKGIFLSATLAAALVAHLRLNSELFKNKKNNGSWSNTNLKLLNG